MRNWKEIQVEIDGDVISGLVNQNDCFGDNLMAYLDHWQMNVKLFNFRLFEAGFLDVLKSDTLNCLECPKMCI